MEWPAFYCIETITMLNWSDKPNQPIDTYLILPHKRSKKIKGTYLHIWGIKDIASLIFHYSQHS